MKNLITIFLFSLASNCFATNYYIKNAGGTGAGTSDATAWSPAKYGTLYNSITAGDTVALKSGESFPPLPITSSAGDATHRIVYTSYGTGAKPIITGMQTITGWTPHATIPGVYYATLDVPRLQTVTVDGALKGMGRYPKTGYLTIEGHNGVSSITASSIGSAPFNLSGATIVIKKQRYIIDQHSAVSVTGNTVNFLAPTTDWGDNGSEISDGNGYFVENSVGTLAQAGTQIGEWYYDTAANRLYMYLGGSSSGHTVQVAAFPKVIDAAGRSYITFLNLDVRGANLDVVNFDYADHIKVLSCDISIGNVGIRALQGGGVDTVDNCTVTNTLTNGISTYELSDFVVSNSVVRNTCTIAGMSYSGDLVGNGIGLTGNRLRIRGNIVRNSGYCGIAWYGSAPPRLGMAGHDVIVENNLVDTFCTIKDDGGGLYNFGNYPQTYQLRIIRNNIVMHGQGNIEGAGHFTSTPVAMGIYLDNFSSQTNVINNYSAHNTGAGIFSNSNNSDTIQNNIVYDNAYTGFLQLYNQPGQIYNNVVTDNQFIATTPSQLLMNFEMYVPLSNIAGMGTYANNYYYRPFGGGNFIRLDDRQNGGMIVNDYSVSGFQTAYNKLQSSTVSTLPISSLADFKEQYNFTASSVNVSLPGVYKDLLNSSYSGKLALPAYSGRVLIYSSVLPLGYITIKAGPFKFSKP